MKRILIIASTIALVLVIGLFTLPYLIPSSVYRAQIEKSATEALGRDVTLLGEARLSVFPTISAKIGGAQVANPEGFEGKYFIEAGELKGSVKLWPLLSRSVEINEITLTDATIRLERLADGRTNWEFGAGTDVETETETSDGGGLSGGIASARVTNTAVFYHDRVADQQFALTEFNARAKMTADDKPITSSGNGRFNGQAFDYDVTLNTLAQLLSAQPSDLDIALVTDYGQVEYDGLLTLTDTPFVDGAFDVDSDTLGTLAKYFAADLPINSEAIETLRASGRLSGPVSDLAVTFANLDFNATGLNLDYEGLISLSELPTVKGTLGISADGAQQFFKPEFEYSQLLTALGKFSLRSDVTGALTQPALSNITLEQRSDLLSTDYRGAISLAGAQAIDGTLSLSSGDLRALLALFGTDLAEGNALRSFALSGNTTGTLSNLSLSDAAIELDDTEASGSFGADLTSTRPRITANLNMPELDLSPLFGVSEDKPETDPSLSNDWSDDPLALDGLKAIDATIDIAASRVILDQIELEDALLKTRLDGGRLSAIFRQDEDKPGFKAFDGNWSGDIVLDASRQTPTLEIDALADEIAAQKMLDSLTGFKSLSGIGDVHLDLSSSGNSIKSLIGALDGNFETDLSNGALKGLNLAKLVRDGASIQDLLASGNLSVASFREAISPEAETDFSNLIGALSITNGVASITDLRLDNPVVMVSGSGSIDLGARTIDLKLVPSVDINAQRQGNSLSLEDIPIPVRVHGSWSNIKFGLDTAAVQAELVARARGEVADEISDRIGGELGGIVGGIIGGQSQSQTPSTPAEQDADTAEAAPRSIEDELKDQAIEGALGAIFGQGKSDEQTEESSD
ncbi:MAG: AsmA family protein [Henriciella sp.]